MYRDMSIGVSKCRRALVTPSHDQFQPQNTKTPSQCYLSSDLPLSGDAEALHLCHLFIQMQVYFGPVQCLPRHHHLLSAVFPDLS